MADMMTLANSASACHAYPRCAEAKGKAFCHAFMKHPFAPIRQSDGRGVRANDGTIRSLREAGPARAAAQ